MSPVSPLSAQIDRFVHDRLPPREQWPIRSPYSAETLMPDPVNLVARLLDDAIDQKGWGDHPLFRSDSQPMTYRQARAAVDRIAHVLTVDLGLVPGNRVLLRGGNSIAMSLAWLAVVKAGLIAVATMPLLRAKELRDILDTSRPSAALCEGRLFDELDQALASGLTDFPVVCWGTVPDQGGRTRPLDVLCERHTRPFSACPTAADDIALLAFTSGTTGRPKAAIHTHAEVLAACEAWPRHILHPQPHDIVAGSPPLAFTFGLGGLLIFTLWGGASVYFPTQAYSPESMVQTLAREGITICYTAPTFYRQMAPHATQTRLPALRACVSAGEGLPDATRVLWRQATGLDIIDGIGATEMFHIFISSAPPDIRPGAIGRVVPGYQAKVIDDTGQEVPRGTVGRLAVIGPTGCRYLNDDRQTQYVQHGWNLPGDAFVQDEDGYFFYQARTDDMIITAGYNVGGPEVEDALLQHPAVAECGVVGQPDADRGMIVKAYCVLKPGHPADAATVAALQDHVKRVLAPYKYPREIEFIDRLPRTETGKLQRHVLRQRARALFS